MSSFSRSSYRFTHLGMDVHKDSISVGMTQTIKRVAIEELSGAGVVVAGPQVLVAGFGVGVLAGNAWHAISPGWRCGHPGPAGAGNDRGQPRASAA